MSKFLHPIAILLLSLIHIEASEKSISIKGISKPSQIIGELGKPCGTILEVTGRVEVVKPPPRVKGLVSRYFIVTHVNKIKLSKEVKLNLSFHSNRDAKHGDIITSLAYESITMHGRPRAVRIKPKVSYSADLHIVKYINLFKHEW